MNDWPNYEMAFQDLMRKRETEKPIDPAVIKGGLLHCSQATPTNLHRRLVVHHLTIRRGYSAIQSLD
jgi:hypothetical protein